MTQIIRVTLLASLVALALSPSSLAQTQTQVPASRTEITLSFAPVVKRVAPAVVNVYAKSVVQTQDTGLLDDPFFRHFFGEGGGFGRPREQVQNSLGSGVVVDGHGFIVTNNHVVENATELRVVLADRREFPAKVLLTDDRTDLAVLKIDVGNETLPSLPFGNSDDLEVGDLVLAIGNPFGVGQTVTSGIVSALARTRVGVTDYQFFIQTDAAINPGNSGGALVNMKGDLVGINTAIYSKSGGSIGIGFSIPANMVQSVFSAAEAGEKRVRHPWLGVVLQDLTQDLADSLGMARPEGALIAKLHPDSPLAAAGLKRGDIIIGFEGRPIENAQEFGFRVATEKIGETRIVEYRRGTEDMEARLQMVAAPENPPRDAFTVKLSSPFEGLTAANYSPAVAEEVGASIDSAGVVVTDVGQGGAQRFFKKGDVFARINSHEIKTVADLRVALDENPGKWIIGLIREGKQYVLRLR